MKKKINSRSKGKNGELEWAKLLTANGFPAERGQQRSGSPDSPDVKCKTLEPIVHAEVKRVEQLNLPAAVTKARMEAAPGQVAYVAHRKNRQKRWLVTIDAMDFFRLVRLALRGKV